MDGARNRVDEELERIEARKAEAEPAARAPGVFARVRRFFRDLALRRVSTKR